jgi:hypothetical protein
MANPKIISLDRAGSEVAQRITEMVNERFCTALFAIFLAKTCLNRRALTKNRFYFKGL